MAKKKRPRGRPRIEIDWDLFESLCKIQCTLKEIAGIMKCSEDTIERAAKKKYGETFAEVFDRFSSGGKASLRRLQWKAAQAGNVSMLKWLGIQYLNQSDRVDTNHEGGIDVTVVYKNGKSTG
jgi:hypothetical protein